MNLIEAEVKACELRSARKGARAALRIAAEWLRVAGGTEAEVEALRVAWRTVEAADPTTPDPKFEFPLV